MTSSLPCEHKRATNWFTLCDCTYTPPTHFLLNSTIELRFTHGKKELLSIETVHSSIAKCGSSMVKGMYWVDEEVKMLIEIWAEANIQQELDGAVRNKKQSNRSCNLLYKTFVVLRMWPWWLLVVVESPASLTGSQCKIHVYLNYSTV